MPGRPAALRARLLGYQVDSWWSAADFTLLVSLDLLVRPDEALAWNRGANDRFVQFRRAATSAPYRLAWASGR